MYTYFVQKLGFCHDWDNYCYTQIFSTLNKVNFIKLVKHDVTISCMKIVRGNRFQLRLEKNKKLHIFVSVLEIFVTMLEFKVQVV